MGQRPKPHLPGPASTDLLAPGVVPAGMMGYDDPYGYGAAPPPVRDPAARSIYSLLMRRKWLILTITFIVAGATIPCIWLFYRPYYKATSVVRIAPVIDPMVYITPKTGMMPQYQSHVNTEVSVIRSPTAMERVLDQPEVQATEWYKETYKLLQSGSSELLERLQESLEVTPRAGTELIDVSFSSPRPGDSTVIADAVVTQYCNLRDELDKAGEQFVNETLTTKQLSLQSLIDGLIDTRYRISKTLGTDTPENYRTELSLRFSALEADHRRLKRELEMTQFELNMLASAETLPAEGPERRYVTDAEWRQCSAALKNAEHAVETAGLQNYGPAHPRMKQAKADVQHAERTLHDREAQLDDLGKTGSIGGGPALTVEQSRKTLEDKKQKQEHEISLLQADIERQRADRDKASEIALEIKRLDEQIRQKRESYEAVRVSKERREMEARAPSRVRPVARAVEPFRPHNDRRILLTAMAFVVALGTGMAVGYLRSAVDKRIYEAGEIQTINRAPFLGLLPKLPSIYLPTELGGQFLQPSADGAVNPRLLLMENMRMIRTTLLERVGRTNERVMLITSSLPHTGKTSVALLLAQSLAVVGKRVLLVEADLRRPVLGQRLGIDAQNGLAALLAGKATDDEVVIRGRTTRFDLVPAGVLPFDFDPELMANGVFNACMARWREVYDFVLLDSPPLLRVADAQILAGSVDGTIMVLRSSHDRRAETMQAFAQLNAVGGTLIGTVLIGGQFGRGHERDGYGYGYDYSYSSGYSGRLIEHQPAPKGKSGNGAT